MSRLWYEKPAAVWEEALPLGNGRLGAMVFGGTVEEHIQLNEDSVWYGGFTDRNNPDALKNLPEIRKLILEGRIPEAEELAVLALSGTPQSQRPYQSLGDLYLKFKDIPEETKEYERSLSLDDSLHSICFQAGTGKYQRETFLSYPDDVMVIRLTAAGKKISFTAILLRERYYDHAVKVSDDTIMLDGNLGRDGLEFAMMAKAVTEGGTCEVIGEQLVVRDADAVTLLFTAGTTFRFPRLKEELEDILRKGASLSYTELKDRHRKDYQELYNRVSFELKNTEEHEKLPADKRLTEAGKGNVDTGLAKLYFDFGRYLLISCSRKGSLPATLQGIWNKDMLPPWDSKYTININTEMNYWPAEVCNLSECHQPLFDLLKRMVPNGRETAGKMYNCRGFMAHHNTDIWGDTAVQDHWIPGSYWVLGAAWLCTHLWTHYEYTKESSFLLEAFPIMKEAALFLLDFMIEDKGYLKTCPSVSPENTYILPDGTRGSLSAGVTMDNQIIRDLFTQCLLAAEILHDRDEIILMIEKAVGKLIPTRIGKYGQIMEWAEDYEELEPGHRHISHLYGLHPSEQITVDKTPELAEAARLTLERRLAGGGGHTGWSRAWIINLYARLWDGEKAFSNLEQLLGKSTLPNFFDNHPPFQIDGNFGGTAAIAEMLVQSTAERIVLLPALPKVWPEGRITGLCVKGGASLDIAWSQGELTFCTVRAVKDLQTSVVYKGRKEKIHVKAGETLKLTFNI